ncbi:DnaJ domain-containing protein [Peptoniphilus duerdenii]|uniref:DnaJ domain-containing protein n=1 Tax=Peptoniphilus duerdenii TaxID=507750 RepID=UPI0023F358F7|nr:DnaJ domain-containing protein [Peptoniphilus duerdenii]
MKKILGHILNGVGKFIEVFLNIIIFMVELATSFFNGIKQMLAALFLGGGCLLIFFFLNPIVLYSVTRNKYIMTIIFLSLVVPILGVKGVSYLKYIQYMATEYFYDRADYYLLGKKRTFDKISDYGKKYKAHIEELERLRRQKEQEEREKEFEERFNSSFGGTYYTFGDDINFEDLFGEGGFFDAFNRGGYYYNQGNYQGNYSGNQNSQGQNYTGIGFKQSYEEAIRILGLSTDADKYEIKLKYRQLAKKYHPDLNKEEGAKEMFQKINNAYEFLSDENIERYKRIKEQ